MKNMKEKSLEYVISAAGAFFQFLRDSGGAKVNGEKITSKDWTFAE